MRPVLSFSRVFGNGSRPYGLRRHDLDLQTPVAGKPGPRLGFVQLAFPYDAFVPLVGTLYPILILAGRTVGQLLDDFINTAGGLAEDRGRELYNLADVKFMVRHGAVQGRANQIL